MRHEQGKQPQKIGMHRLAAALANLSRRDDDYWTYRRMSQRPGLHGLVRYPAMMVPRMQGDLLDAAIASVPMRSVVDPFVGSGTTLLEVQQRGIEFTGYDINALAILICRAKLLDLSAQTVRARARAVELRIAQDRSRAIGVEFFGRDKWFTKASCQALGRIRRAIMGEPNVAMRRFLWVVMSETVRQTSLSRETTYKLHIRTPDEIAALRSPIETFQKLLELACQRFEFHTEGQPDSRKRAARVRLHCKDIRNAPQAPSRKADLLLTSPPYGDNESTITYGQFSYLALNWIDEQDLEGSAHLRHSAYAIDSASLGGSMRNYRDKAALMSATLPSFRDFFKRLERQGRPDLEAKAASFTSDFFEAIGSALQLLHSDGLAVWTLGERTIGGMKVPLVDICREISEFFGMEQVTQVQRRIQSKRNPVRNSMGSTMLHETLLVMAGQGAPNTSQ